ncbi:hypothetical protein QKW35_03895 [Pontibacterium granulatum]|uniref:hypothetical protein n=1 Tax=Pontibacterium granulatum TaxID=2036029 RepID=UPI00249A5954|nr:hypothetical protein [Pontibacterium granulatum]MDI3323512.1 hypothetical protein [Pontibacterium granulatum]
MNRSADLPDLPALIAPTTPEAESEPPTEPEPTPEVVKQAREHIDQITAPPEDSIDIEKADHFVTASQLLKLPIQQTESEAVLETVDDAGTKTFGVETGAISVAPVTTSATPTIVVGEAELTASNRIKLQELLDRPETSAKQVFYIHAVNEGDSQGLWGILQRGLTRTFAEGIVLGKKQQTLYVEIPEEADEKLENQLSSFLGKVLQQKVESTYIYNYRSGRLGDDPDLIEPGQQLIIVEFSEDELVRVYNHFIRQ